VGTVVPQQEFNWNVRGSATPFARCSRTRALRLRHQHAAGRSRGPGTPAGLTLSNIVITNGGGYAPPGSDTDPTITDLRIFVGDGTQLGTNTTSGLLGATCFSWVSTDAGDQQINLVWVGGDGLNYNAAWDTDGDGNGQAIQVNRSLVKEWNRLEDSQLTINGVSQGTTQNVTRNIGVVLNPATGLYQFTSLSITDIFRGSHTNSAGVKEGPAALAGVMWAVDLAPGSCGLLNGTAADSNSPTVTYNATGETTLEPDGTVGSAAAVTFSAGAAAQNCAPAAVRPSTSAAGSPARSVAAKAPLSRKASPSRSRRRSLPSRSSWPGPASASSSSTTGASRPATSSAPWQTARSRSVTPPTNCAIRLTTARSRAPST